LTGRFEAGMIALIAAQVAYSVAAAVYFFSKLV